MKTVLSAIVFYGLVTFTNAGIREGGNGGSTVKDEAGNYVLADLYYKARNYELPSHYGQRITLGANPQGEYSPLSLEIKNILRFLNYRASLKDEKFFPSGNFFATGTNVPVEYEIYQTETLSGEDPVLVEDGKQTIPTAYSYEFVQNLNDGKQKVRRIIEVKPSVFDNLSLRHKALELIHEFLHLEFTHGHDVIIPLIKNLDILLSVQDRQKAGDLSKIKISEYNASKIFQNLVAVYKGSTAVEKTKIDPNGGGVIKLYQNFIPDTELNFMFRLIMSQYPSFPHYKEYDLNYASSFAVGIPGLNAKDFPDTTNYFGVDSFTHFGKGYRSFANNVVLNSIFAVLNEERACNDNVFKNMEAIKVVCMGSNNKLENIINSEFSNTSSRQQAFSGIASEQNNAIIPILFNDSKNNSALIMREFMGSTIYLAGDQTKLNLIRFWNGSIIVRNKSILNNIGVVRAQYSTNGQIIWIPENLELSNISFVGATDTFLKYSGLPWFGEKIGRAKITGPLQLGSFGGRCTVKIETDSTYKFSSTNPKKTFETNCDQTMD